MTKALLVLLVVVQATQTLPPPAAWEAAERAIVRLPPAAFRGLPEGVRVNLERRQCTIPQPDGELEEYPPYNVIKGRFTSARSIDIAVLCSKNGVSTILVFRGGSVNNVAELASSRDAGWLQTGSPKPIVFSRAILPASPDAIRTYYKEHGGPEPPPLDHDGIHNLFVSKASIIHYWHLGKWLELTGAD
jgi:hypothetical protein